MSDQDFTALLDGIREKCQRQRWFGGDENNTARYSEEDERYEYRYTSDGTEVVIDRDPDDHPRKSGFAYSPATEEQLQATEAALEFPLPPLLRAIYAQIANGGFGPGYGIPGAKGGFAEAGDIVDSYLYHKRRSHLIDLATYKRHLRLNRSIELADSFWPEHFLYLCDWGLANASCVHSLSGQIFHIYPSKRERYYRIRLQAQSLEDWIASWSHDQLREKGKYVKSQYDDSSDEKMPIREWYSDTWNPESSN